eukprot:1057974-Rhodomonas_salina.4
MEEKFEELSGVRVQQEQIHVMQETIKMHHDVRSKSFVRFVCFQFFCVGVVPVTLRSLEDSVASASSDLRLCQSFLSSA